MKSPVKPRSSRGRPRNQQAHDAILRAARELLAEAGPGGVTMEAVAARAGVSKPTVYRWWPDRHAVIMAALLDAEDAVVTAASPSALDALRQQLAAIAERFATPTGRYVAAMIAASDADTELSKAFRNHFVMSRRAEGRALLERAIAAGEVRPDLELEVALDLLYGPLFFRLLMGHARLDAAFTARVVDHLLAGLAV